MIEFYKKVYNSNELIKISEEEAKIHNFFVPDKNYYGLVRIKLGNIFVVASSQHLVLLDDYCNLLKVHVKYTLEEFFDKFPESRNDLLFNMDILK